jgi:hypothetical protein
MKTIYLATAESRNFSFQAIATTEEDARSLLLRGLQQHGEQFNLEPNWWDYWADINIQPLTMGEVYRDYQLMKEVV